MRIALLLIVVAVMAASGCASPKPPPRMPWVTQTRSSCRVTADLLAGLAGLLKSLDASWNKELSQVKGPKGRLRFYNPGLFTRLSNQLAGLDVTQRKLKKQLTGATHRVHYQYMPRAPWMIAQVHRTLGLLDRLKTLLQLAASTERIHAEQLGKRKRGAPDLTKQKSPRFGMLIRGSFGAVFTGEMGAPVKRRGGRCVGTTVAEATGYRLSDGSCYYFTAKPQPGNCPRTNDTLRVFRNSDAKLFRSLKCLGSHDVMFDAYVHQLHQLRWILGRLKGVDLTRLAATFRHGVPTQKAQPVPVAQSKRACWSVSRVLRDLGLAVQNFRHDFSNELDKSMRGHTPLKAYNERLISVLLAASKSLDLTQPPLQKRLARDVWSTPFTHAKVSAELLPLLHRYFGLLSQLTVAVRQAHAFERRTSKLMTSKRLNYRKPALSPKPRWGAIIENDRTVRFVAQVGEPVTGNCKKSTVSKAAGYRLANGTCRYFSRSTGPGGSCQKTHGTFRYFQNTDGELVNRIRCVGRPVVAFREWTYRLVVIKLLLMELKKLNATALTKRFAKAAE